MKCLILGIVVSHIRNFSREGQILIAANHHLWKLRQQWYWEDVVNYWKPDTSRLQRQSFIAIARVVEKLQSRKLRYPIFEPPPLHIADRGNCKQEVIVNMGLLVQKCPLSTITHVRSHPRVNNYPLITITRCSQFPRSAIRMDT